MIYLILAALLSSPLSVLAMVAALFIHELGHILAGYLVKEPVHEFELTPFGGILRREIGKSMPKGIRGVITAAGGPAANYLMLMLLGQKPVYGLIGTSMTIKLISANVTMILLNLLPVLPLDGGRIVFSIGFYFVNVSLLIDVLSYLGCFAGIVIIVLSLYGLTVHGILNCSLLMIGGYIAVCAYSSRNALICENAYSVVQERASAAVGIQKTHVFSAEKDTKVLDLLPIISRVPSALFICRDGDHAKFIFERDLLCAVLESPSAMLGEINTQRSREQNNQGID